MERRLVMKGGSQKVGGQNSGNFPFSVLYNLLPLFAIASIPSSSQAINSTFQNSSTMSRTCRSSALIASKGSRPSSALLLHLFPSPPFLSLHLPLPIRPTVTQHTTSEMASKDESIYRAPTTIAGELDRKSGTSLSFSKTRVDLTLPSDGSSTVSTYFPTIHLLLGILTLIPRCRRYLQSVSSSNGRHLRRLHFTTG